VQTDAPRLVKRYDNRKLYDVKERRYVTLDDLRELLIRGQELEVRDQRTGEDLTNLTLAQVLLEGLRQRTARIPRPLLVQLVRLVASPAKPTKPHVPQAARRLGAEAERIAAGLLNRGRLTLDEALALRQEIVNTWGPVVAEAQAGLETGLHRLLGGGPPQPRRPRSKPRPTSGPRKSRAVKARGPARKGRR
jgi:polyhydroxyalkanoate synthesis repressor PhaR